MVLLEFAMSPTGQSQSMSAQVARLIDIIDRSGTPYQLTPMGTILEGDWDEVMGVVRACFEALRTDCPRIGVHIKIDYREGSAPRMKAKVDAVRARVGRPLST